MQIELDLCFNLAQNYGSFIEATHKLAQNYHQVIKIYIFLEKFLPNVDKAWANTKHGSEETEDRSNRGSFEQT